LPACVVLAWQVDFSADIRTARPSYPTVVVR
jgi:hypothetical protein